ncbi:hypothetical protein QJQ45_006693 [Haematococcus lacustris]|nr:hypothetical protein QJQ45_006693 [Haematococcus lacustris]
MDSPTDSGSLLDSNASEELLQLELQYAQSPQQLYARKGQASEEAQFHELHGQVDHLHLLLATQANQQDKLQVRHEEMLEGQQSTAEHLQAAQSKAQMSAHGLQALQGMLSRVNGFADHRDILDQCNCVATDVNRLNMELQSAVRYNSSAVPLTEPSLHDEPGIRGKASMAPRPSDSVREREAELLQQLASAHRVFKLVEEEVTGLQQQAQRAAARLLASEEQSAAARAQLQRAINLLQQPASMDKRVAEARLMVNQSLTTLEQQGKAVVEFLAEFEAQRCSDDTPGLTTATLSTTTSLTPGQQGQTQTGQPPLLWSPSNSDPPHHSPSNPPSAQLRHTARKLEAVLSSVPANAAGTGLASHSSGHSSSEDLRQTGVLSSTLAGQGPAQQELEGLEPGTQLPGSGAPAVLGFLLEQQWRLELPARPRVRGPSAEGPPLQPSESTGGRAIPCAASGPLSPAQVSHYENPVFEQASSAASSTSQVKEGCQVRSRKSDGGSDRAASMPQLDLQQVGCESSGPAPSCPSPEGPHSDAADAGTTVHARPLLPPPDAPSAHVLALQRENNQLVQQVLELQQELVKLRERGAPATVDCAAQVTCQSCLDREADFTALQREVVELQDQLASQALQHQATVEQLQADYQTATGTWERLQAHKQLMASGLSAMQRELRTADARAQAATVQLKQLQQQVKAKEAEVANLQARLASVQAARASAQASAGVASLQLQQAEAREQAARAELQQAHRSPLPSPAGRTSAGLSQPGHCLPSSHGRDGGGSRAVELELMQQQQQQQQTEVMAETLLLHRTLGKLEHGLERVVDVVVTLCQAAALAELEAERVQGQAQGTLSRASLPVQASRQGQAGPHSQPPLFQQPALQGGLPAAQLRQPLHASQALEAAVRQRLPVPAFRAAVSLLQLDKAAAPQAAAATATGHGVLKRASSPAHPSKPFNSFRPPPDVAATASLARQSTPHPTPQQPLLASATAHGTALSGRATAHSAASCPSPNPAASLQHQAASPPLTFTAPHAASPSSSSPSGPPVQLHQLQLHVSQLQDQLELEGLRASNAQLQRQVAEMELAAMQKQCADLRATVRDLRVHIQDLQIQSGFARTSLAAKQSGGSPHHASLNTSGAGWPGLCLSPSVSSPCMLPLALEDLGSRVQQMARGDSLGALLHSPSLDLSTQRRFTSSPPRTASMRMQPGWQSGPTHGFPARRCSGSSSPTTLPQTRPQDLLLTQLQVTASELQGLVSGDCCVLAATVQQLQAQLVGAAGTQAGLRAALQQALRLGEQAAGQADAAAAAAEAGQRELRRCQQVYRESYSVLQTLYDEAQQLNRRLWAQWDQEQRGARAAQGLLSPGLEQGSVQHDATSSNASSAYPCWDSRRKPDTAVALSSTHKAADLAAVFRAGARAASVPDVQVLQAQLTASRQHEQQLQQLLFSRNRLITELQGQLMGVSEDVKTFEATVVRVEAQLPPPAQDQPAAQPPPGPVPRPQAPPWGRWLDRDTNPCLNFQRIGESKQRPLELCRYEGLMALLPIGKEYQQGYKRLNDRLPKVKQRLHRAAEFRRGIDGRARNNA